jgi:hypothetical protein
MITQLTVFWALLLAATVALALWRKGLSMTEDTYLHLSAGEARYIPKQLQTSRKLHLIDRCGESLTVATAVLAVFLGAAWIYEAAKFYRG